MNFMKKTIAGEPVVILDLVNANDLEIEQIKRQYSDFSSIRASLSQLHLLSCFRQIRILVLTDGISTSKSIEEFYLLTQPIESLVLDYERLEGKSELIDLARFASLKYVLSRSNKNYKNEQGHFILRVLNQYGRNSHIVVRPCDDIIMFQFFSFTTEAESPATEKIASVLKQIQERFAKTGKEFSQKLGRVGFVIICLSKRMYEQGFCPERKYISWKKKYADYRIRISQEEFLLNAEKEQEKICIDVLKKGAASIADRDSSFDINEFNRILDTLAFK